jgi:hypothetical protein
MKDKDNMENVKFSRKGSTLTIEVDLAHRGNKSESGKTTRVASTEGNVPCPDSPEIKVGLNIFTK